jgi:hypothetical protein
MEIEDLIDTGLFLDQFSQKEKESMLAAKEHALSYRIRNKYRWMNIKKRDFFNPRYIAMASLAAVMAVLTGHNHSNNNEKIQCDLMAEGRSLSEGAYDWPYPTNRTCEEPLTFSDHLMGRTGYTISERVNRCLEEHHITVDPEMAKKSAKKTERFCRK